MGAERPRTTSELDDGLNDGLNDGLMGRTMGLRLNGGGRSESNAGLRLRAVADGRRAGPAQGRRSSPLRRRIRRIPDPPTPARFLDRPRELLVQRRQHRRDGSLVMSGRGRPAGSRLHRGYRGIRRRGIRRRGPRRREFRCGEFLGRDHPRLLSGPPVSGPPDRWSRVLTHRRRAGTRRREWDVPLPECTAAGPHRGWRWTRGMPSAGAVRYLDPVRSMPHPAGADWNRTGPRRRHRRRTATRAGPKNKRSTDGNRTG